MTPGPVDIGESLVTAETAVGDSEQNTVQSCVTEAGKVERKEELLTQADDFDDPDEVTSELPFEPTVNQEKAADGQQEKYSRKNRILNHHLATVTMARLYTMQGHIDEAINIYREILIRDPSHQVARRELDILQRKTEGAMSVK